MYGVYGTYCYDYGLYDYNPDNVLRMLDDSGDEYYECYFDDFDNMTMAIRYAIYYECLNGNNNIELVVINQTSEGDYLHITTDGKTVFSYSIYDYCDMFEGTDLEIPECKYLS